MDDKKQPILDSNSLETPDDGPLEGRPTADSSAPSDTGVVTPDAPMNGSNSSKENPVKKLLGNLNIYFILLLLVLVVLFGVSFYAVIQNRKNEKQATLNTTKLSSEALANLSTTDSSVGDAKQTLTVESNAIFTGGVLIKGNIDIAGGIKVGANLSLPSLNVGGTTTVETLAAKSLTVSGDTAVQGKVTIQNGLNVSGATSFSSAISAPQVTTNKLQLNGDLQLSRHITSSGGIPNKANGSALGGGGSASNSGNDISGTITINTGNSAPAGCFITLTFAAAYSGIPRVIITPAGSAGAGIDYYVNRTASGFSVCTASDPPDNTANINFDYIVIG